MDSFKLVSTFTPKGDQPNAIDTLCRNLDAQRRFNVLLGVTGSGKTFAMAHVIARLNRPALIIAPNKTLAAQLYNEFKGLFPENAVEYFVSYYDYYQPEAYLPSSDTYIAKDSSINEMIDKLRHSATRAVLTRRDVLVVASVSCIFGLGAPEDYLAMRIDLEPGVEYGRERLLHDLVSIHYERNDIDFHRGVFRVRGDRVEIFPAHEEATAVRVDFFGDEIDEITEFDPLNGQIRRRLRRMSVFPASHYVTQQKTLKRATETILAELKQRVAHFREGNQLIEAQRIEERTQYDVEMLMELGYCNGIENYSRHFTGRQAGDPPPTLLDYFPDDYLVFIDESHIAVPQIRGMYLGDRSRKQTLVEYGFRLPSALDNRPLQFGETFGRIHQAIFVSATPADYELEMGKDAIAELIVRPTGLIDPQLDVRPATHQVDDLYTEICRRVEHGERVLVTTLTKRMAEDLSEYYTDLGLQVRYLHADINTLERMEIIRDLRLGKFDVLVGINLLREGLDIPEVSLVAILDADKEGYLRSVRSLIQTFGRAARNVNGRVLLYADRMTGSMDRAIQETHRRRGIQQAYNQANDIQPESIVKEITAAFQTDTGTASRAGHELAESTAEYTHPEAMLTAVEDLKKKMHAAAETLDFERAAVLRDRIKAIEHKLVFAS